MPPPTRMDLYFLVFRAFAFRGFGVLGLWGGGGGGGTLGFGDEGTYGVCQNTGPLIKKQKKNIYIYIYI